MKFNDGEIIIEFDGQQFSVEGTFGEIVVEQEWDCSFTPIRGIDNVEISGSCEMEITPELTRALYPLATHKN